MLGEIDNETKNAFADALKILAQKNIAVFFYHRPDAVEKYNYSETAIDRMKNEKSFVKMCNDPACYEKDLRELLGNKYSEKYIKKLKQIPQVVKIGDRFCHIDFNSEYINVKNGFRATKFQPQNYSRSIHFYGRCGAFGYAVEDGETIPSYIQKMIIDRGYNDIRVVNHGLWGGEDSMIDHNFLFELKDFNEEDIVVFYRYHFNEEVMEYLESYGLWYKDITIDWHKYSEASWCFYDKPGHMNSIGYRNAAEIIVLDLISKKMKAKDVKKELYENNRTSYLDDYIKKNYNADFDEKIKQYISGIRRVKAIGKNNGAIVMNCNPFTLGHRYLIEYASKKVDYLYIFIVEENKSLFDYKDRYEMVIEGVKDIKNVIVVPSGKFIISSYTFPEYFIKDFVKEKNVDVSKDLDIFCKYIAPGLSIKKRFVGQEPIDYVTKQYNDEMKITLPKYSIQIEEIERKRTADLELISASKVRKLMLEGDFNSIKEYVPETTYRILCDKYV